jgi:hypothetical protein
MAHFAQLDQNNIVTQVIVVDNKELLDNGVESETKGVEFCNNLLGGTWIQTSYNGTIRKNYAGIGFVYDTTRNAFISPKPFESWLLNESTCKWESPIPMPTEGIWQWDETTKCWIELPTE